MASTITITGYSSLTFSQNTLVQAPAVNTITEEQKVSIGPTDQQSAPLASATRFVLINCDVACCLAFNAAADPTLHRLTAGESRFCGINPGTVIHVIAAA
jgi:hypothetical protein